MEDERVCVVWFLRTVHLTDKKGGKIDKDAECIMHTIHTSKSIITIINYRIREKKTLTVRRVRARKRMCIRGFFSWIFTVCVHINGCMHIFCVYADLLVCMCVSSVSCIQFTQNTVAEPLWNQCVIHAEIFLHRTCVCVYACVRACVCVCVYVFPAHALMIGCKQQLSSSSRNWKGARYMLVCPCCCCKIEK